MDWADAHDAGRALRVAFDASEGPFHGVGDERGPIVSVRTPVRQPALPQISSVEPQGQTVSYWRLTATI